MSDRDDFEEIASGSNGKSKRENGNNDDKNEIYSTKRKITHIIRQNPLVHMGEKSEKPTVIEKLRRAFSTEDTYSGGFIADEEPEGGGLLGDSEDIFSEFVSKLKNARMNKDSEKEEEEHIQTDGDVAVTEDTESEEEYALLSSFLDGGADNTNTESDFDSEHYEAESDNCIADTDTDADESSPILETVEENSELTADDSDSSPVEAEKIEFVNEQNESAELESDSNLDTYIQTAESENTYFVPDAEADNVLSADVTETENEQENESSVEIFDGSQGESIAVPQAEEARVDKLKNKGKQLAKDSFSKVKSFLSDTKSKLLEMWNEKSSAVSQQSEITDDDSALSVQDDESLLYAESVSITEESVVSDEVEQEMPALNNKSEADTSMDMSQDDYAEGKNELSDNSGVQMTVIKNETSATMEIDTAEVRKSLNVITNEESDSSNDDFEILLEEPSVINSNSDNSQNTEKAESSQSDESTVKTKISDTEKHQNEANQKVLDKVKEYERKTRGIYRSSSRDERSARAYEKEFGEIKPITQIEITDYLLPGQVEEIKVKAGKFSESVRAEYEFYIGYKRLQSVAKSQSKLSDRLDKENSSTSEQQETLDSSDSRFENFVSERNEATEGSSKENVSRKSVSKGVEYRSEEDQEKIKKYILRDYKKSRLRFTVSSLLTLATFILFCFNGKFAATTAETAVGETGAERVFALINLFLFGAALYTCKDILADGLRPLRKLKVSADTSVAFACVVTAVQAILVVISPAFFFSQSLNVYTLLALLALALNSYGRYMTAKRAKGNFAFVISSFNKYTARFYHDPRMTAKILSNTSIKNSKIVFQKRTSFLKNFIKLTYAEDEGERTSERFTIPAAVVSVIVSIIYGFLSKSFLGAMSVLSVMLCMAVPMCCRLLGALPMYQLSKSALKNQAMVVGYPAVEHFSDSCAIMIDAKELYPEGSVHMNGIKTFSGRKIDDALFAAAAVMVNAGGAMAGMFDGIIQGNKEDVLPPVESLVYEDDKGLIGWVNNERVLVGNRFLLEKHGIEPPSLEYERKYRRDGDEILYLASSGELVAMFIIGYSANRRVMDALRRMESNGMSLLIRTVDVNITPERISKDFGIYHETVKILPTAMGNIIRDEMIGKEKSAPAYIATKGGVVPLGRAVSGCIKAKRNISLSIAIQAIEILLGLLLVTTIVLFSGIQAGIQQIGAIELFVFSLFWSVAIMIAPFIQKS